MELIFFIAVIIAVIIAVWAYSSLSSDSDDHEIIKRRSSKNANNSETDSSSHELTELEENEIYRQVNLESANRQKRRRSNLTKFEDDLLDGEKSLQALKDRLIQLEEKYRNGDHKAHREIRYVVGPAIEQSKKTIPGLAAAVKKVTAENQSNEERELETQKARFKSLFNSAVEKKRKEKRRLKIKTEPKRKEKEIGVEDASASAPLEPLEKEGWQLGAVRKTDKIEKVLSAKNVEKIREGQLGKTVRFNKGSSNLRVTRSASIKHFVEDRGIKKLVHFSPSANLNSILANGLLPRTALNEKGITYTPTDSHRFDRREDGLSLSVEFTNHKMLAGKKKEIPGFSVFFLKPSILWEKDCAFFRTNAASMSNADLASLKSPEKLYLMFDASTRDVNCPYNCPNDLQAEIMVFGRIETKYVKEIHTDHKLNLPERAAAILDQYGIKVIQNSAVAFANRPDW